MRITYFGVCRGSETRSGAAGERRGAPQGGMKKNTDYKNGILGGLSSQYLHSIYTVSSQYVMPCVCSARENLENMREKNRYPGSWLSGGLVVHWAT